MADTLSPMKRWEWSQLIPVENSHQRACLSALAWLADKDTLSTYAGVKKIAERMGCHRTTTLRTLNRLAELGMIHINNREGHTSVYTLSCHEKPIVKVVAESDYPQSTPVAESDRGGSRERPGGSGERLNPSLIPGDTYPGLNGRNKFSKMGKQKEKPRPVTQEGLPPSSRRGGPTGPEHISHTLAAMKPSWNTRPTPAKSSLQAQLERQDEEEFAQWERELERKPGKSPITFATIFDEKTSSEDAIPNGRKSSSVSGN